MKSIGLFAYGETGFSALKSLIKEFEVLWIVIPRGQILPIEAFARDRKVEVVKITKEKEIADLLDKKIPDAVVISSYNKIISSKVLKKTKFINIHHGDLPRFRGRANINWAIINNRKELGLTFHEAIEDVDAGNVYKQFYIPIDYTDNVKTIYDKFNALIEKYTGKIVTEVLNGFKGKEQKGKVSYCCTRIPEDGYIDWNKTSLEIYNLIRALTRPYPGAFTYYKGKRLFIWSSEIPKNSKFFEGRIPGRIVALHKNYGVEILTKDSSLIIKDVTYRGIDGNPLSFIKSVKDSLGINIVELFEKIQHLL